MNNNLNRRDFIQRSGLVGAGIAAAQMLPLRFLQAQTAEDLANPPEPKVKAKKAKAPAKTAVAKTAVDKPAVKVAAKKKADLT